MKQLLSIYMGIFVLMLSFEVHAGAFVEPYLGYDQATLNAKDLSGSDMGAKNSGLDYGARLGYRLGNGVWFAGEYAAGSGDSKSNVAGAPNSTYTRSAMGAVVGFDHGQFRFWGGYGLSDKLTAKAAAGTETTFSGSNYKVGLGFKPMSWMSVNFEYVVPTYSKYDSGSGEADVSSAFSQFDTTSSCLTLSFPFDFSK